MVARGVEVVGLNNLLTHDVKKGPTLEEEPVVRSEPADGRVNCCGVGLLGILQKNPEIKQGERRTECNSSVKRSVTHCKP